LISLSLKIYQVKNYDKLTEIFTNKCAGRNSTALIGYKIEEVNYFSAIETDILLNSLHKTSKKSHLKNRR